MTNPCMSATTSCSACCGIFNLKLTDAGRSVWVRENTEDFLRLDISKAENIVAYRQRREAVTLPQRIRDDIYVCPFVGYVDGEKTGSRKEQPPVAREPGASMRTGCLLHPQGSPHPQISLWEHPQNFSFYGEGICLSYDCLAKERKAHRADFFQWAETASVFHYSRLASDHTLHRALAALDGARHNLRRFYSTLAAYYAKHGVVTTSFEDVEKAVPETLPDLCLFLANRISPDRASVIARVLVRSALTPNPSPQRGEGSKTVYHD